MNLLTGSGSHGMTGAKESTARLKTIAAQVVDHRDSQSRDPWTLEFEAGGEDYSIAR